MSSRRLVVLGQSGLLGQAVKRRAEFLGTRFIGVDRSSMLNLENLLTRPHDLFSELNLRPRDLVLNAIGKTKQLIDETDLASKESARWLNAELPALLSNACAEKGIGYLQIGTDCVFSGRRGSYSESDSHDARDFYGRTKSIGESGKNVVIIRTSFVGPAQVTNRGLWGWIYGLPRGSTIEGFEDHLWNGVTTEVIANIILAGFQEGYHFNGIQHLIPKDVVTKGQLVALIADRLSRRDLIVEPSITGNPKNMTLSTNDQIANLDLWRLAGFDGPLTIRRMIEQQALID